MNIVVHVFIVNNYEHGFSIYIIIYNIYFFFFKKDIFSFIWLIKTNSKEDIHISLSRLVHRLGRFRAQIELDSLN